MKNSGSEIKLVIFDVDGTLTDGGMYVSEKGDEMKKFNTKDGMGIKLASKKGIEVGFISASISTNIVYHRAKMLGVKYCYAGKDSKLGILQDWLKELNLDLHEVAFVGDDINDIEIMQCVGLSACPADAMESVKKIATIVLEKNGGAGCGREFIDKYLLA